MDLLAIAKNAADRVEAASVANKVPIAVCVIDVHGNVVLQHRMNGAPVFSIELSERKVRWVAECRSPETARWLPESVLAVARSTRMSPSSKLH